MFERIVTGWLQPIRSLSFSPMLAVRRTRKVKVRASKEKNPVEHALPQQVIHFNMETAEKESDIDVPRRFYRLPWGGWIRCVPGRRRFHWRHSAKYSLWKENHLLVSQERALEFDQMVNDDIKRPSYYPEDIYEPYKRRWGMEIFERKRRRFYP